MGAATVREFCLEVLERGDLESKLRPPLGAGGRPLADDDPGPPVAIDAPRREAALAMRPGAARLPDIGRLREEGARRLCLERFAHHELMAVELFAWALVTWPDMPPELRRALLATLADEQRHLRMYLARLAAAGGGLGDSPLSSYLWRHVPAIRASGGPLAFLCALGLTFEQANLDFAGHYGEGFRRAGDEPSAEVLRRVRDDEVGHVRLALTWLRRLKDAGKSDFDAYVEALPFPLSAARAKGRRFDAEARRRAGLDEDFIARVEKARPYARG